MQILRTAVGVVMILGMVGPSAAADRLLGGEQAMRSAVYAPHGMVASAHPLASQIGLDVLRDGGNAIDAAVAMNAALGLMEPTGSGVGGDLFAIVWDAKTKKLYGLNASGRSPQALQLQDIRAMGHDTMPLFGALPVTVPGAVDGWFELLDRFGSKPMAELLAPTIRYAREGHPVPPVIAYYWSRSPARYPDSKEWWATYAPGGKTPVAGELFRNPHLAATYEKIAAGGRDAFYTGEIAQSIVDALKENGGAMSLGDLAAHDSEWVDPVSTSYRGWDVWELPPNTQGIAALQMLNMLEPHDLAAMGHNSVDYLHLLVETKKIVYEDRARWYADQAFYKLPIEGLLSRDYAQERMQLFDPEHASKSIPPGDFALRHGDTTYLTVVDAERNAISLIQSNYMGFGSGIVPKDRGFTLQNRGNLFSLDAQHANAYAPGKRPFHTIIPAFVTRDGQPVFSFGVMGGDMQPQGHVQVFRYGLAGGRRCGALPSHGLYGTQWRFHAGRRCPAPGKRHSRPRRSRVDPQGTQGYGAPWRLRWLPGNLDRSRKRRVDWCHRIT